MDFEFDLKNLMLLSCYVIVIKKIILSFCKLNLNNQMLINCFLLLDFQ